MKNLNRIILPVAATALVFGVTNCKKSETDKLVGQWEITEVDGDLEDMLDSDYAVNLEFHLEGDAEFCMLADAYKICFMGDWEWEGSGNDKLTMNFESQDGENETMTINIDSFKDDEITGEMTLENADGEEYVGDVTLERVYVDKSALKDSQKK
jgi:hypothetical protein